MNTPLKLAGKIIASFVITLLFFVPAIVSAHCDTLAGPVVIEAKEALEKGDITPVLKWIKKENEHEIRDAFKRTLAARKHGKEAQELADMYFFETLVRIHRAGEGAPYTGLKPGEAIEPIIAESDRALESGSVDMLVKHVTGAVEEGIREKFAHARETKMNSGKSIAAGREYVEAYVIFTHYVERLYNDATTEIGHHGEVKPEVHHTNEKTGKEEHRH